MTELSTKTSTDDSRIGSHSAESPTMTTSCEVASEPKMVCGEVGAQLRVSIDHSSCPSARDLRRLIDAGNEPGGNRQAIPGIDGRHRQRQVAQLLLAEVRSDFLVDSIRHVAAGDQGHGLRPCQGSALAIAVVRAFAPGVQRVESLLPFPDRAQILPVHVQAVGAAVDLRGPESDQMKQRLFQSTSLEVLIQGVNGLVHARGGLGVVEAWFHAFSRERGGQISASVWGTSSP